MYCISAFSNVQVQAADPPHTIDISSNCVGSRYLFCMFYHNARQQWQVAYYKRGCKALINVLR